MALSWAAGNTMGAGAYEKYTHINHNQEGNKAQYYREQLCVGLCYV